MATDWNVRVRPSNLDGAMIIDSTRKQVDKLEADYGPLVGDLAPAIKKACNALRSVAAAHAKAKRDKWDTMIAMQENVIRNVVGERLRSRGLTNEAMRFQNQKRLSGDENGLNPDPRVVAVLREVTGDVERQLLRELAPVVGEDFARIAERAREDILDAFDDVERAAAKAKERAYNLIGSEHLNAVAIASEMLATPGGLAEQLARYKRALARGDEPNLTTERALAIAAADIRDPKKTSGLRAALSLVNDGDWLRVERAADDARSFLASRYTVPDWVSYAHDCMERVFGLWHPLCGMHADFLSPEAIEQLQRDVERRGIRTAAGEQLAIDPHWPVRTFPGSLRASSPRRQ